MNILRKSTLVIGSVLLAALLAASGASAQAQSTEPAAPAANPLSEAAVTKFVEQFNAIFNEPNIDIADEILAPDFTAHLPLAPMLDRSGWKAYANSFLVAIPDLKQAVNKVIVGEDRVVLYVTYTGTQNGPLLGIPATGKPVKFDGIGIFRFEDNGLVAENWAVIDVVGLLAQIGAFPPKQ